MYHSISFDIGDKKVYNTWNKWYLIPTTRPVVAQPTQTYNYVEIPGRTGALDITDYLFKGPTYSDRVGSFEFLVTGIDRDRAYASRKADLARFFDGSKVMKMTLEDNPGYYYKGRFFFKQWTPEATYSRVTIEYRLEPYRYTSDGKVDGL